MPIGFAFFGKNNPVSWNYETVPQKEFEKELVAQPVQEIVDSAGGTHKVEAESLEHRKGFQPRGKTLGGSSSINAMLYVRGHKWDYDHWSQLGNEGWSYEEVLPYFKKAEHNEMFDNNYHGQDGPLMFQRFVMKINQSRILLKVDLRFLDLMKILMEKNKKVLGFINVHKRMEKDVVLQKHT